MAHAAIGKAVGRGRERDLREIWRTEGGRQWARALTTHTSDERPLRSTVLMPRAARWDSIGPLDDAGNTCVRIPFPIHTYLPNAIYTVGSYTYKKVVSLVTILHK